jgi:pyruvate-formate lyase-activating enzyme
MRGDGMKVDKGFNLYVDVTASCNASCPFCIAPTVGRKNDSGFLEGLVWALDFTQRNFGSVQVTGGEPTLSSRLRDVMREVSLRIFHRVVLNTNGAGIKTPGIVIDLESSGFTHVNLSRHHYDEERNQEIMRFNRATDYSNQAFIDAVESVIYSGMMPRINCNLLRGYVDSADEIQAFVSWCESFGVRNVSFSETFPLGVFDQNLPIVPGYAESHAVELKQIVSDLDERLAPVTAEGIALMSAWGSEPPPHSTWSGIAKLSSSWGSSGWSGIGSTLPGHRRFWQTPNDGRISIKTLAGWNNDGTPKPPSYSKQDDPELRDGELYFAVVHPDGMVTASWDKRERILFAPQLCEVLA